MKLRLPRILAEEDELDRTPESVPVEVAEAKPLALHWPWMAAIAAVAALPRLVYLLFLTDPENPGDGIYTDVWHHWQIAYLTKEIGLTAPGGPRLWDLKGLDYFWGVLHPALMVVLFTISGSIDIVLNRLLSATCGVAAVVLLFRIVRHYWGTPAGAGAALVAAFLPTSVMNDASGMLEPLGIALCLAGIWAWTRRRGGWSGVAFGLATMARAEAWIFGLGMVIAGSVDRYRWRARGSLIAAFAVVVVLYMLLLLNKTGNPIYPLWWNFLANAAGKWEVPITPYQASVRPVLGAILLVALVGLVWSLLKRPRSHMLLVFGFGYWVFTAGLMGFTSYLADWSWWTPIGRHFEFPYVFVATLVVVVLIWWMPRRFGAAGVPLGWAVVIVAIVASQLLYLPISQAFGPTEKTWNTAVAEGRELGGWYNQAPYRGHALAIPPDRPDLTYVLARYGGVEGKHIISEMYDPFAYPDSTGDMSARVQCWLQTNDIQLIAISQSDSNLTQTLRSHPDWFVEIGSLPQAGWAVEGVRSSGIACYKFSLS